MKYETHNFYCLKCGNKGIPLMRPVSKKREKFHRKKLYCIVCGTEVNHIECKNLNEILEFQENFKNGIYLKEAEESILALGKG